VGEKDVRILATDIDTDMVAAGAAGRYAMERAAAIPAELRQRFVRRVDAATVEMDPVLKALIAFKPLNLLGEWPMRGPFDAIFCRNVVIYFDKPTQRVLFDRFAEMLAPDGLLFIGHSESLFRVSERFQHLGRTVHRRIR
jgi:chemotaxis protein methyltransferase CheR